MRLFKRIAIVSALAFTGLAIGLFWFVKVHGFSAREKPTALEAFFARRARNLSIPAEAGEKRNPLSATPIALAEARDHFADHCAVCHANDGSGMTEMGSNMYPPTPDMRKPDTQELTDGQIFYIIRNGIRFTGMPGWGGEGDENWKLVLFIRHLPQLTAEEVELMKEINHLGSEKEMSHR